MFAERAGGGRCLATRLWCSFWLRQENRDIPYFVANSEVEPEFGQDGVTLPSSSRTAGSG